MNDFLRSTEAILCAIVIMITLGIVFNEFGKAPLAVSFFLGFCFLCWIPVVFKSKK